MHRVRKCGLMAVLLLCYHSLSAQSTVFIESSEIGRGVLLSRNGECFVISPYHVVENSGLTIDVFGDKSVRSNVELVKRFPNDIAVLRVTDGGAQNCTRWSIPSDYASILDQVVNGYLEVRQRDGSASLMQVNIRNIEDEFITVQPRDFRDKFTKGLSGAALFTTIDGNKIYLGMLQSVEVYDDGTTDGYVLQSDDIARLTSEFFIENQSMILGGITQDKLGLSDNLTGSPDLDETALGFRLQGKEIRKNGSRTTATFTLTSLTQDQQIRLSTNSIEFYDESGKKYQATDLRFGSVSGRSFSYELIQGVPVELEINFSNVSSSTTGVTQMRIGIQRIDGGKHTFSTGRIILTTNTKRNSPIATPRRGNDISEKGLWHDNILDFDLNLVSYRENDGNLLVHFKITSFQEDRPIRLHSSSFEVWDDRGGSYKATNLRLGNNRGRTVSQTLEADVITDLYVEFAGFRAGSKGVVLFSGELGNERSRRKFQLRNLSFFSYGQPIAVDRLNAIWSTEILGLTVDLISYSKTGTTANFKFQVTSTDSDQVINLSKSSIYLFDEKGNRTQAAEIKLGNQLGSSVKQTVVANVPTNLDIVFRDIRSAASGVALFRCPLTNDQSTQELQIRNLAFGQATAQAGANCSDIFLYRLGAVGAEKPIYLFVGNRQVAAVRPGERFRITTCEKTRIKLHARLDRSQASYGGEPIDLSKGGTHYVAVTYLFGLASVKEIKPKRGYKDFHHEDWYNGPVEVINW